MDELTTYDDVNNAWSGATLPPISTADASRVFTKLVRRFGGRKMRLPRWYRRRCWASTRSADTSKPRVNGLPRMVHDASHWVFGRLHPGFKTHSAAHAALEKQMIEHVIAAGLHRPKVAPAKPPQSQLIAAELAKVESRIKRWQTKAKRAATALRKLSRKQKNLRARYEMSNL